MTHDQLWKEVLTVFFSEFVHLLLPKISSRVNLSQLRPMDKELFTHSPAGRRREPDIVMETEDIGETGITTLVHVEVQARRTRQFPRRMWEYFSLLTLREGVSVLPVALFLLSENHGNGYEEYVLSAYDESINIFRYHVVALRDLKEEDYVDSGNPLAPAVCALMQSAEKNRVSRKIRLYERIARAKLDDRRTYLLASVVDQYLPLDAAQVEEWNNRVRRKESKEVSEMLTQWQTQWLEKGWKEGKEEGIKEGIKEGIQKGIREGIDEGMKRTLLRQIKSKFGILPEKMAERIRNEKNPEKLEKLSDRVLFASSLEEMFVEER